jgi:hypothetical protein
MRDAYAVIAADAPDPGGAGGANSCSTRRHPSWPSLVAKCAGVNVVGAAAIGPAAQVQLDPVG